MASEPDYYKILHVSSRADRESIIAAYRRLARKYHPDLTTDPVATERMRDLNTAVEILSDPQKRAQYNVRRARSRGRKVGDEDSVDLVPYQRGAGPSWSPPPRWKPSPILRFSVLGASAIALAALTVTAILVGSDSGEEQPVVGPGATATPSPDSRALSPTPAAAGASRAPASPETARPGSATFSHGTWLVSEEIVPGMWRAIRPRTCSWKRLASLEGATDIVAASGSHLTVEIRATDAAFWSEGCGWWTQVLTPPSSAPEEPFGAGTWLVHGEIAPGVWRNSDSSEGCSWAKLSSLDGEPSGTIASGSTQSVSTIEIGETELAFDSKGCGTWTRIAD